ncbi:MAG TPA: biosynthetic peptidoglycan transglycosylase [bacterium]|nr:biosynthetic peptidoglycan transglycosylase [bacterium]
MTLRRLRNAALLFAVLGAVIFPLWLWLASPDPSALVHADPETTGFIRQRCPQGGPGCSPRWTPLKDMSPFIPQAVVLAEDIRFFRHGGLDLQNLWTALTINWRKGTVVWGGSTITQQLAKNLYLGPEKTAARKFREIVLTLKLERSLSKDRILEIYLNVAQWGPSLFGIANASERYFGKTPAELGPLEASYLASILPNPEHAEEPAWRDKFREAGVRLFDTLFNDHLSSIREPRRRETCRDRLAAADAQQLDYLIAKAFDRFPRALRKDGGEAIPFETFSKILSPDEWALAQGLLRPEDRVSGDRALLALVVIRQNGHCADAPEE